MKRPGASMGIGTPVEIGSCSCCAIYRYGSMHIWQPDNTGTMPIATKGVLSIGGLGIGGTYDLDITPVYGRLCGNIYYETFTLDILDGGEVVGQVTYEYLSGWVFAGNGNLIVEIDGHVYKALNGGINGGTPDGLRFYLTDFNEIDGVPQ